MQSILDSLKTTPRLVQVPPDQKAADTEVHGLGWFMQISDFVFWSTINYSFSWWNTQIFPLI